MLGLLDRPDTKTLPQTGGGFATHIVKERPGYSAGALVTEARVFGTPLEALCGHRWVPSRDPKNHPLCQACKDIFDAQTGGSPDLPEPA